MALIFHFCYLPNLPSSSGIILSSHSKLEYYLDVGCAHALVGTYLLINVRISESRGRYRKSMKELVH